MDWLWSWAAQGKPQMGDMMSGSQALAALAVSEKEPTERRARAIECLDVLQESLKEGYDSIHEILEEHGIPLVAFLSTLPSSSSTPQPLLRYLLTLPRLLTSPNLPSSFSNLQLINANEALQVLAELAELETWSSAHLAPLSLALFYACQSLQGSNNLEELLRSAPMTGLKVIGPGRSVLGVLGRIRKLLRDRRLHLDRGLASIAQRELSRAYEILLGRSETLPSSVASSILQTFSVIAVDSTVLPVDVVSHVPNGLVWTTARHLVSIKSETRDNSTATRVVDLIRALVQRPSLQACDFPSEALHPFAHDLCHLLADAQVTDEQAKIIFESMQTSALLAVSLQDVVTAQAKAITHDIKDLPVALAISRVDGSNYELLLALTMSRRRAWVPILRALGHDVAPSEPTVYSTQQVTENNLLAIIAPELAKALQPASTFTPSANPYNAPSNTASAYSGKMYTQQEFRATRYVKGQPFVPMGYGPPANHISQGSRAPSRHVDDFIM